MPQAHKQDRGRIKSRDKREAYHSMKIDNNCLERHSKTPATAEVPTTHQGLLQQQGTSKTARISATAELPSTTEVPATAEVLGDTNKKQGQ